MVLPGLFFECFRCSLAGQVKTKKNKKTVKKIIGLVSVLALCVGGNVNAASVKDGDVLYSPTSYLAGQPIPLGVDAYGYNYQAHAFSGSYFNSYANGAGFPPYEGDDTAYLLANPSASSHWAWPYRNDQLAMKWNEAWLSNQDRDNDGKLDRHYGYPAYIGSGAWLTNHASGEDWNDFVKIVAVPASATESAGFWYDTKGREIGQSIWGEFALTQEVYNDPSTGDHGILYGGSAGLGLGQY